MSEVKLFLSHNLSQTNAIPSHQLRHDMCPLLSRSGGGHTYRTSNLASMMFTFSFSVIGLVHLQIHWLIVGRL